MARSAQRIRSGDLDDLIDIQRPPAQDSPLDEYGRPINPWTRVARVHSMVSFYGGSEQDTGQSLRSVTLAKVVLRYMPGLDTTMRVYYKSTVDEHYLYITSIERERRRGNVLILHCEKRA